jgi:hypothetical protein
MSTNIELFNNEVVIIGGGTCGLYLANALLEQGFAICIIESGDSNWRSFNHQEYSVHGQKHNGISIGRCIGFGGTSNLWGGQMIEFDECDFSRTSFNQPNWPIEYAELEPYYLKVRDKLSIPRFSNPLGFRNYTHPNGEITPIYTSWLSTTNFKSVFYDKIVANSSATILPSHTVHNIEFSEKKATVINSINNNTTYRISGFSKIILANGTIEISRLLLNLKRTNLLLSNNQNIGSYFQDHIELELGELKPTKKFFKLFSNGYSNGKKYQVKLNYISKNTKETISLTGVFNFQNKMNDHFDLLKQFGKSLLGFTPEKKIKLREIPKIGYSLIKVLPQVTRIIFTYWKHNKIYVPFGGNVIVKVQAQQISKKSSNIELDDSKELLPKVKLNWQIDGREYYLIKDFAETLTNYFEEFNLGVFEKNDLFIKLDHVPNQFYLNISDTYHASGGAIMGINENTSVVSSNCLVHNTENLFVCGPAVMPTSGSANTGLTMLALAERLVTHIKASAS